ncbi:hypothetical protein TIFTF001_031912 [Ficus carica]|uniref:Uncharacterized protein n=1 Tax=Ficus carica TaxID=3494 RepID=A0AA88DWE3_FICCA|nr:hypothetical protein TIFTF001_031912 [Ficus carica]
MASLCPSTYAMRETRDITSETSNDRRTWLKLSYPTFRRTSSTVDLSPHWEAQGEGVNLTTGVEI